MADPDYTPKEDQKPEQLSEYWDDFKEPFVIPRLSDEKLREFVNDYVSGRIFTLDQVRDKNPAMAVFMPLIFDPFSRYKPETLKDVGTIYQYMHEALPRSINGMPCFLSFHILHTKDWERALKAANAEISRRSSIELPPDE